MRTTLNIENDLYRRVKSQAALQNRSVTEFIESALRQAMEIESEKPVKPRRRVVLPLIDGGRPAAPGQEMTPERTSEIMLEQESAWKT